jgi:hypothetical protein
MSGKRGLVPVHWLRSVCMVRRSEFDPGSNTMEG